MPTRPQGAELQSLAVAVLLCPVYRSKTSLAMGSTCSAVDLSLQSVFGVFCNIFQDGKTNDPLF